MIRTKLKTQPPAVTPEKASSAVTEIIEPSAVVVVEGPKPNIKFTGRREFDKRKLKVLKENAPLTRISDAGTMIYLPSANDQVKKRFFHHPEARNIARMFPHLYKLVKPKAKKSKAKK